MALGPEPTRPPVARPVARSRPDPRAVEAIALRLDDEVARVRRNAAHALGCVACKPEWTGGLPDVVIETLTSVAADDSSAKVRAEAADALVCRYSSRNAAVCIARQR